LRNASGEARIFRGGPPRAREGGGETTKGETIKVARQKETC
jgi:hypothetical protein